LILFHYVLQRLPAQARADSISSAIRAAAILILEIGRVIFRLLSVFTIRFIFASCSLDIGPANDAGVLLARLFGNRKIVVGSGLLYVLYAVGRATATEDKRRRGGLLRNWAVVNLVTDVLDAVYCLLVAYGSGLEKDSMVRSAALSIGGAALGLVGLGGVALQASECR
jgi:hypothetical protein